LPAAFVGFFEPAFFAAAFDVFFVGFFFEAAFLLAFFFEAAALLERVFLAVFFAAAFFVVFLAGAFLRAGFLAAVFFRGAFLVAFFLEAARDDFAAAPFAFLEAGFFADFFAVFLPLFFAADLRLATRRPPKPCRWLIYVGVGGFADRAKAEKCSFFHP
jgi:hypothetical protein